MKIAVTLLLLCVSFFANADDAGSCEGTILQRRLALVQFGQLADAYIKTRGALPDICSGPVAGISDAIPNLLRGASVCGSSKAAAVHYSCVMPVGQSALSSTAPSSSNSPVIETCRYSLVDQSVSCENRAVVTRIEEPQ